MDRRRFTLGSAVTALSLQGLAGGAQAVGSKQRGILPGKQAQDLADGVAQANSTSEAFDTWFRVSRSLFIFSQMTALVCKTDAGQDGPNVGIPGDVRRIYSSVPIAYPVGGWKHLSGSDWAQHVLVDQKVLIASGPTDLARYFPDHALLASLGARTLVNIPVVVCRRTVGAFAFLCPDISVNRRGIDAARQLTVLMAGPFLMAMGDQA